MNCTTILLKQNFKNGVLYCQTQVLYSENIELKFYAPKYELTFDDSFACTMAVHGFRLNLKIIL